MKITLIDGPKPEVCALAASMCYNAKNGWNALESAMEG